MPNAYSVDLRRKVVEGDGRGGRTQKEGADALGIGVASGARFVARAKKGTLACVRAATVPSRRVLDEAGEARVIARSPATPDASDLERAADLADAGIRVRRSIRACARRYERGFLEGADVDAPGHGVAGATQRLDTVGGLGHLGPGAILVGGGHGLPDLARLAELFVPPRPLGGGCLAHRVVVFGAVRAEPVEAERSGMYGKEFSRRQRSDTRRVCVWRHPFGR